jgi:hypothetical protein
MGKKPSVMKTLWDGVPIPYGKETLRDELKKKVCIKLNGEMAVNNN